jgi:hypothetical protein
MALVTFASPSETVPDSRGLPLVFSSIRRRPLPSEDEPRALQNHRSPVSDSSLGVVQRSPLHRNRRRASTPRSPEGSPLARGCHTSKLVPSLSFLPTSTVYSAHRPAGLLHPASGHGIRCVSSLALRDPKTSSTPALSQQRTSYPSEPSPRRQPHLVTKAVAPSWFRRLRRPSRANALWLAGSDRPPQGFAPTSSPLPHACVSTCAPPDALLGFAPLQGPLLLTQGPRRQPSEDPKTVRRRGPKSTFAPRFRPDSEELDPGRRAPVNR